MKRRKKKKNVENYLLAIVLSCVVLPRPWLLLTLCSLDLPSAVPLPQFTLISLPHCPWACPLIALQLRDPPVSGHRTLKGHFPAQHSIIHQTMSKVIGITWTPTCLCHEESLLFVSFQAWDSCAYFIAFLFTLLLI